MDCPDGLLSFKVNLYMLRVLTVESSVFLVVEYHVCLSALQEVSCQWECRVS